MTYRSVGDVIAVCLEELQLPISDDQAIRILNAMGFSVVQRDITEIARNLIGKSSYRRGARPEEAPGIVDCSSMVKWIYGQLGIWLPRYSIDQRDLGNEVLEPQEGDLVFSSGWRNYYWINPDAGVGHVGIFTKTSTVVHAANKQLGVIECDLEQFTSKREKFRGLRRYLSNKDKILVMRMDKRKVETSQELRWLILQRL